MEKKAFNQKTYLYRSDYAPDSVEFMVTTDGSSVMVIDPDNGNKISIVWSEQLRHFVINSKDKYRLPRIEQAIDHACFQLLLLRNDGSLRPKAESPHDQIRSFFG